MSNESFISQIAPIIQKYAKERGYKVCSAVIAQAILESNWGKSQLAAKYFNFFGLKSGSSWKGKSVNMKTKEEYTKGTLTTIKDNFRVYDSMEDGVKGYYDFINTKRYANLKNATTARQYLEIIKSCGYATSSAYVDSNMAVVNKYNLTKYDDFKTVSATIEEKPKTVSGFQIGKVYTTISNMVIRDAPNGNKVMFSDITEDAKKHGHESSDGGAVINRDARVTCKDIKVVNGQIWMRIPSGWICAIGKTGVRFVM